MAETRKVSSSHLEEVSYDDNETMTVKFKGGGVFEYTGVPRETFEGLCSAKSCGSYLHRHVKANYPFKRIG